MLLNGVLLAFQRVDKNLILFNMFFDSVHDTPEQLEDVIYLVAFLKVN